MSSSNKTFTGFQTFARRLNLKGTLRLETALRIGTGQADELSGADIAVIKDAQRHPFIPGSSFKGALRAHVERLVRGLCLDNNTRRAACDPLIEAERCISVPHMQELREVINDPASLAERVWSESCRVCRVFGSPWLASKMLVKDLTLKYPDFWFERSYQVRMGVGIERDSDAAQENVLYSSETVPPGTEFTWEIIIENADPDDDEPLVCIALREMEKGHVLLGGAKSRGLGRVSLTIDEVSLVDASTLVNYLITNQPQSVEWNTLTERIPLLVRSLVRGSTGT